MKTFTVNPHERSTDVDQGTETLAQNINIEVMKVRNNKERLKNSVAINHEPQRLSEESCKNVCFLPHRRIV